MKLFGILGLLVIFAGIAAIARAQNAPASGDGATETDPFLWLEDVHGARAMAWVKAENAKTLAVLQTDPRFAALHAQALRIAQAKDRIPAPTIIDGQVYNFWQDKDHVRGIWRRTSLSDYASASPAWTTVARFGCARPSRERELGLEGADCAWPAETAACVFLSDGGEDAITAREFDLVSGTFVNGGFVLPQGKQTHRLGEHDTLLVSREWSPGELTTAGLSVRRQTA